MPISLFNVHPTLLRWNVSVAKLYSAGGGNWSKKKKKKDFLQAAALFSLPAALIIMKEPVRWIFEGLEGEHGDLQLKKDSKRYLSHRV